MEFLLDFILHIDQHMIEIVQEYHTWAYAILFLIIFCETGLVATPFLPGDSLLFLSLIHICRRSDNSVTRYAFRDKSFSLDIIRGGSIGRLL